jgi:peptide/nickel transport system substrate-binding protein
MMGYVRTAAATALLVGLCAGTPASAQKPGGILKVFHFDTPASMSMLEEATGAANRPMMGVFNNLVRRAYSRSSPISPLVGSGVRTAPS